MSSRFDLLDTPLANLTVLLRKPLGDARGYLERLYCFHELSDLLNGKSIMQINHTLTTNAGTIRGMHFQYPPYADTKLVSCTKGEVFDVAVDIRRGSPTFLKWHAEILSASNHKTFVIPEGFAHGFQTLTDDCEMLYFHTSAYAVDAEGALNAQDPRLAITWPRTITERSARDQAHPMLAENFTGVAL